MSNIGINQYKRAVLYDRIAATHQQHAPVTADWFNSTVGQHVQHPVQKSKGFLIALAIVAGLHFGVWVLSEQFKIEPLPITKPEPVVIEIIKPKEEPPKIIEPKIPPITKKVEIPPVQSKPVPVSKPIEKPVVKSAPVKPVEAKPIERPVVTEKITEPVKLAVPEPPAEKPAPPAAQNLPVSEAKGYAGYLSNPAPEYPEIALERGWEGSVLLRVKVSASGSPLSVEVKQGSGKKALDDAALRTVKRWKFSPAMRGSTAIEGWVDVPINFKLPA
ncbi:energy transducer TonB [Acinetobacter sp. ANC 5380]|uniref:Energy transducer TonB n=1 Tax=Acinetobacter terrae TaxID=2731247 RepID=A0A7Y2W9U2_9GAMM|nr:energy transducer TonB [Acinetobacter terrae]NNH76474.1 energy transducer TonB [Acinetobacter terrae]